MHDTLTRAIPQENVPHRPVLFDVEVGQSFSIDPRGALQDYEAVYGGRIAANFQASGMDFLVIDTRRQVEVNGGAEYVLAQVSEDGHYSHRFQGIGRGQAARVGHQEPGVFEINPDVAAESFQVSNDHRGLLITNMDPGQEVVVMAPIDNYGRPFGSVENIGAYYSPRRQAQDDQPAPRLFDKAEVKAQLRMLGQRARKLGGRVLEMVGDRMIEGSPYHDLMHPTNQERVTPLRPHVMEQQTRDDQQEGILARAGINRERFGRFFEKAKAAGAGALKALKVERPESVQQAESDLPPMLSRRERQRILRDTEIHGTSFQGVELTPEDLNQLGLEPKFPVELDDGVSVAFSDVFYGPGDRLAVIGYVQTTDGRVVARSNYLSSSQATWRYLPSYVANSERTHYDKGYGQESLDLPIDAQAALAAIAKQTARFVDDRELAFFGTARDKEEDRVGGKTYMEDVDRVPRQLKGDFYGQNYADSKFSVPPPENLMINERGEAPNLAQPLRTWKLFTPRYGEVTMTVYPSYDGQLTHQIASSEGVAWTASLQDKSKVTHTALRERWVDGGVYLMTKHQYEEESGGYGGVGVGGGYVDMSNYLSRTPLNRRLKAMRQDRRAFN
jgi:hypothetical protein